MQGDGSYHPTHGCQAVSENGGATATIKSLSVESIVIRHTLITGHSHKSALTDRFLHALIRCTPYFYGIK
jgi:hypothetical protein